MADKPEIFISCVSGEFRSTRQLVANTLLALGYLPIFQEIFGTEGDLRQVLRDKVDPCQAMIQIIGDAYGAEPPTTDPDYGRVSYTQFEFLYARLRGLKRIIFFAQPGCDRDAEISKLDLPRDAACPDPAAYQRERRDLQTKYRNDRFAEEALYYEARNTDHLVLMLHTIKNDLAQLRADEIEWKSNVMATLDTMERERRAAQAAIREGFSQQHEKLDDIGTKQDHHHRETKETLREIKGRLEALLTSGGGGGPKVLLLMQVVANAGGALQKTGVPTECLNEYESTCKELLSEYRGFELERSSGFLYLFERPINAVGFAIAYHAMLRKLSGKTGIKLGAQGAAHLGEVHLRSAPGGEEKVVEVDGFAKLIVSKVVAAAQPGQTLLTRSVFDLARQSTADEGSVLPDETRWITHGSYFLRGIPDAQEIYEAGVKGVAPLTPPDDSENARRANSPGEADLLGWRPFPGVSIPGRSNWRVVRKLGEGGFGEAWLVEQPKSKQRSVYKFCFDPAHLAALKREMTLLRALSDNPASEARIAKVLDWNLESPPHFLEIQFYEAGSLVTYVDAIGGMTKLALIRRLEFLTSIADALSIAHRQGILHRDVKPSNILIEIDKTGKPRALLGDFGVGTILDRQILDAKGITGTGLTTGGKAAESSAGTRLYIAPELLEGKAATSAADVYSFGVTMYQLIVGDLHQAVGHGWTDKVHDEKYRDLIALCIHQDPDKRIQDMSVVFNRLRALSNTSGPLNRRPSDSQVPARPSERIAAAAASNPAVPKPVIMPPKPQAPVAPKPIVVPAPTPPRSMKRLLIVCGVALLLIAAGMGYTFYNSSKRVEGPLARSIPPVVPTPAPSPVPVVERVTFAPAVPVPHEMVKITFDARGGELENAQSVYIHFGVNDWASPGVRDPRPAMTQISPKIWQLETIVEEYAWQLDMVFMDGDRIWDKNGGRDWHFPTTLQKPGSLSDQQELGAYPLADVANLKTFPDRTKIRAAVKLVAYFEGVKDAHPALLAFVDANGHQMPAVYGPEFAQQLKGDGTRLQLGAIYDLIGWKRTYRKGAQLSIDMGGRLVATGAVSQPVGWSPPVVALNQLQGCEIWSLARTKGILKEFPNAGGKDSTELRWRIVDPAIPGLEIPVRVFAGADFTKYFQQLAGTPGDFILYVRRGPKDELEANFMMVQNLKGLIDMDPSLVPRVALNPTSPMRNRQLTISYRPAGTKLEKSNPIFIDVGYDGWQGMSDRRPMMVQNFPGTWQHTITVPSSAKEVDFVFTDWQAGDGGNWDKNDGKEWLAKTIAPPTPTPSLHQSYSPGPMYFNGGDGGPSPR